MLTISSLKDLGANTVEGLGRCMNNETFYLRMVDMGLRDQGFDRLSSAIETGNLKAAFEAAHSLKGTMGNLALTPIAEPVTEITELLRSETQMDYGPLLEKILTEKERFCALLD